MSENQSSTEQREQREHERMEAQAAYTSIAADCDLALWALVDGNEREVVKRLAIIRKRARNALIVFGIEPNE